MIWKNSDSCYGALARSFHWLSALIVLGLLLLGVYMAGLAPGPGKLDLYWWHKSFGTLLFFLVLARLFWRFADSRPAPIEGHRPWERILAKLVHVLLYIGMIGMPLSGLLMSAAGNFAHPFFGFFNIPDVVPGRNEALLRAMREAHEIVAFCLLGAIMLHGIGAFKHHFIDRDATLTRMLPGVAPKAGAVLTAALFGAFACGIGILLIRGAEESVPAAARAQETETAQMVLQPAPLSAEGRSRALASPRWVIIPAQSAITFTAVAQGQTFDGVFERFDGEIFFDPDNLPESHAAVSVDIASVKTGSPERDAYIAAPAWLDAPSFPQARLSTTRIVKTGDRQYIADADLMLRGIALPVEIPFTLTVADDGQGGRMALMEGSFTIRRLDFGVGAKEWADTQTIANDVVVKTQIKARAP